MADQIGRSPQKKPWVNAPALKLRPVYLQREEM